MLEYVGPLVETHPQEKPMSIALREIHAGMLVASTDDPADAPVDELIAPNPSLSPSTPPNCSTTPPSSPSSPRGRCCGAARVIVGVAGGIAAYKAASLVRLFTEADPMSP